MISAQEKNKEEPALNNTITNEFRQSMAIIPSEEYNNINNQLETQTQDYVSPFKNNKKNILAINNFTISELNITHKLNTKKPYKMPLFSSNISRLYYPFQHQQKIGLFSNINKY